MVLSQLDGTGVGGLKRHSWIEVPQLDHGHTAGLAKGRSNGTAWVGDQSLARL